ncbi:MAG TPA: hypothetical protein VL400_01145 [Polyangiaceae bacterium]|nr:hypothetical protein [Polyangiaceae bacterium]
MRRSVLVAAMVLAGCASDAAPPKAPPGKSKPAAASGKRTLPGPPGLPSGTLASAAGGASEAKTAFATRGKTSLFVFDQGGHLYARSIAEGAAPAAEVVDLGAHGGLAGVTLKSRGDGYVLFEDERVDQNHVFTITKLDTDGKPVGAPFVMPPVAEAAISWADVALVGDGAVTLHEVTRGSRVSVFATPLSKNLDAASGTARPIAEGVLAWDVAATKDRLGFAFVRSAGGASAPGDAGPGLGSVDVVTVDAAANASPSVSVESRARAEIDAEIASVGDALVVAWTDIEGEDASVRVAAVSGGKLATPPKIVAPPVGDQALVGLVADPTGRAPRALLAWENVGQGAGASRIVQLTTLGADASPGKERARVLLDADDAPDLVADGDGFALLTLAPARLTTEGQVPNAPSWPTALRLGPDLSVKSAEPIRISDAHATEGVPDMAFDLACSGGACAAIAADAGPPMTFYAVDLPARESPWRAPAWREDDERAPRVASLRTVADGPRLSRARAATIGGADARTVVAWVTYFLDGTTPVDAAPKGEAPFAATLALRSVGADGSSDDTVVLSKRALSPGGVSIAAPPGHTDAVVAWVAGDKTGPQVYATKIDARGKKLAQKRVTTVDRPKPKQEKGRSSGEPLLESLASSVAIAYAPPGDAKKGDAKGASEGYVVAWVDGRDGNGEVYAARLNKDLEKVVVDKRVTKSQGDASDVSCLVRGDDAFVVFADERDGSSTDIYLAHLDAASLRVVDADVRVYASAGASRAPELVPAGKAVLLAWIEEPARGESQPTTVRIAEIDASGRLVGAPRVLRAPDGGSVTGFSLTCGDGVASCKGVLSWARGSGRPEAGGFTLDAAGTPTDVVRFGTLSSGPFADPSMTFGDSSAKSLFFVEDTSADQGRVRAINLGW